MSKKYVTQAPSGVTVEAEFPPPPYEDEDGWMTFGVVSFWFFSWVMWGKKVRDAYRKPKKEHKR